MPPTINIGLPNCAPSTPHPHTLPLATNMGLTKGALPTGLTHQHAGAKTWFPTAPNPPREVTSMWVPPQLPPTTSMTLTRCGLPMPPITDMRFPKGGFPLTDPTEMRLSKFGSPLPPSTSMRLPKFASPPLPTQNPSPVVTSPCNDPPMCVERYLLRLSVLYAWNQVLAEVQPWPWHWPWELASPWAWQLLPSFS